MIMTMNQMRTTMIAKMTIMTRTTTMATTLRTITSSAATQLLLLFLVAHAIVNVGCNGFLLLSFLFAATSSSHGTTIT